MALVSHLVRRGGSYSARMRVPLDLIEVMGKREVTKSLGTNNPKEAKVRLPGQIAAWQREFADYRIRRDLTLADKEHAVWDAYTAMLERDDQERDRRPDAAEVEAAQKRMVEEAHVNNLDLSDPLAVMAAALDYRVLKDIAEFSTHSRKVKLAELRTHLIRGETVLIADEVDAYLRKNGLIALRGSLAWVGVAKAMMRAEMEALQRTLERDRADYTGEPRDPLVRPASGERRTVAKPGESIMEVFEVFARENPRGVAKDRVDQCRRDIRGFVDVVGATFPIAKIGKTEVRAWKNLLAKYPVKATESNVFAGMNMVQIVKANEKVGKPVIADRTVNRYLSSLGAFLSWAVNNGFLSSNPVEGMMLAKEVRATTYPFKTDQLQTLFSSPWFVGCESSEKWRNLVKPGNVKVRDHRFWVPLIMLFSGARPGEIGQLAVNDIRQDKERWIMHITTEGDDHDQGKSVKTAGSMRVVPIHSELIRLGFLRYHAKRIEEGGAQLFPGATRNSRGQMASDLSREFPRYLAKIGIKKGRGLSLYSFRHGATDALRRAGFLDAEFGHILGHTPGTMTQRYGVLPQGMLEQRTKLVEAIAYPGLNLDHLSAA